MKFKKVLGPGVWIDDKEELHFSIPDLLEHFDIPDTPANQKKMRDLIHDLIKEKSPETKITDAHVCPSCGRVEHTDDCQIGFPKGRP